MTHAHSYPLSFTPALIDAYCLPNLTIRIDRGRSGLPAGNPSRAGSITRGHGLAIKDELESSVNTMMVGAWSVREGRKVPDTDDIGLSTNTGVTLDATYLYADLAKSSVFGQSLAQVDAAKIIKSFLYCCSALIREHGGEIKSFDGDRVMGVYFGAEKEMRAARTAFKINWVVQEIINDKASRWVRWPAERVEISHATGIATGEALLIRGGVRNDNDIASIGAAPNLAAKLSDQRTDKAQTFVCTNTWMKLYRDTDVDARGHKRWTTSEYVEVGGKYHHYYASNSRMVP